MIIKIVLSEDHFEHKPDDNEYLIGVDGGNQSLTRYAKIN